MIGAAAEPWRGFDFPHWSWSPRCRRGRSSGRRECWRARRGARVRSCKCRSGGRCSRPSPRSSAGRPRARRGCAWSIRRAPGARRPPPRGGRRSACGRASCRASPASRGGACRGRRRGCSAGRQPLRSPSERPFGGPVSSCPLGREPCPVGNCSLSSPSTARPLPGLPNIATPAHNSPASSTQDATRYARNHHTLPRMACCAAFGRQANRPNAKVAARSTPPSTRVGRGAFEASGSVKTRRSRRTAQHLMPGLVQLGSARRACLPTRPFAAAIIRLPLPERTRRSA